MQLCIRLGVTGHGQGATEVFLKAQLIFASTLSGSS